MDIEYYREKDENSMVYCVEYNTDIGRNFINVDDIEDVANC